MAEVKEDEIQYIAVTRSDRGQFIHSYGVVENMRSQMGQFSRYSGDTTWELSTDCFSFLGEIGSKIIN